MKQLKLIFLSSLAFFLVACATARISQHLEMGKQEFLAGNYQAAYRELLPLASEGNPDAEYAVGYMYYYGYGAPLDADTGIFWMKKAADQNNANAIAALQKISPTK